VVTFSGDPSNEHPDESLRGQPPSMRLIACGDEEFCWAKVITHTATYPLRMWERSEVLARDVSVLREEPHDQDRSVE
jgi:hypothetical protein